MPPVRPARSLSRSAASRMVQISEAVFSQGMLKPFGDPQLREQTERIKIEIVSPFA